MLAVLPGQVLGNPRRQSVAGQNDGLADAGDPVDEVRPGASSAPSCRSSCGRSPSVRSSTVPLSRSLCCAVPGPVARGVLSPAALPAPLERGHPAADLLGIAVVGLRRALGAPFGVVPELGARFAWRMRRGSGPAPGSGAVSPAGAGVAAAGRRRVPRAAVTGRLGPRAPRQCRRLRRRPRALGRGPGPVLRTVGESRLPGGRCRGGGRAAGPVRPRRSGGGPADGPVSGSPRRGRWSPTGLPCELTSLGVCRRGRGTGPRSAVSSRASRSGRGSAGCLLRRPGGAGGGRNRPPRSLSSSGRAPGKSSSASRSTGDSSSTGPSSREVGRPGSCRVPGTARRYGRPAPARCSSPNGPGRAGSRCRWCPGRRRSAARRG